MHAYMLANARHALTVAEHAKKAVEVHEPVVVDDLPELEVIVVGQCDRATTLQASLCRCSEAFQKGYGVGMWDAVEVGWVLQRAEHARASYN